MPSLVAAAAAAERAGAGTGTNKLSELHASVSGNLMLTSLTYRRRVRTKSAEGEERERAALESKIAMSRGERRGEDVHQLLRNM